MMRGGIWKMLFGFAAVVTLWFAVKVGRELQRYHSFSKQTPIEVQEWGCGELEKGKFGVMATYTYQVGEQKYGGTHIFTTPVYKNPEVVDGELYKWKPLKWIAWYSPKHPEKSSLQHNYPVKSSVQAFLSLGILVYFAWLRMFVTKTAKS